ncbi:hypothetical protein ACMXYN_00690 [Neptuniibacter sp. PT8_73]|uniref:hypothetical protein n=1 Tax=Neptuniibacter sp. PT8_73 TaxID=3398206 RepID=UPI0039F600AE
MGHSKIVAEADLLMATLDSLKQVNSYSLLLSGSCVLLLLFGANPTVQGLALLGFVIGLAQGYFNWRVALDRKLLPLLMKMGIESFDRALAQLFTAKAKRLNQRDLSSRLSGVKDLARRQMFCFMSQLIISICAFGLFLQPALF